MIMRRLDRDLLAIGAELFYALPDGRKKRINWIKLFRKKTGLSFKEALEYYYAVLYRQKKIDL